MFFHQRGQAMLEYVAIGVAIVLVLALGTILMQQVLRFNVESTLNGVSAPKVSLSIMQIITG